MPPQAVELEEAVLGALMLEKDSIIAVQEYVTPDAFYTEEHRTDVYKRQLLGREVPTGEFGADMQVALVNDGPVTIWIDSKMRDC